LVSFLVRGADHMLSEKSQWTENGTMFVDLDWLLNTSSPLSASAELLVGFCTLWFLCISFFMILSWRILATVTHMREWRVLMG